MTTGAGISTEKVTLTCQGGEEFCENRLKGNFIEDSEDARAGDGRGEGGRGEEDEEEEG